MRRDTVDKEPPKMYNRTITIDAAKPGKTLDELHMGQNSSLLLVMRNIPDAAASVAFVLGMGDGEPAAEFAAANEGNGIWSVLVRSAYFTDVGTQEAVQYRIAERTRTAGDH